jgi:hypothetical protein
VPFDLDRLEREARFLTGKKKKKNSSFIKSRYIIIFILYPEKLYLAILENNL